MRDNKTSEICEQCNSHIINFIKDGELISECSYCGESPDELSINTIGRLIEDEE